MIMKSLIYTLYDSITNSIFASQILNPLLKLKGQKKYNNLIIVSFEKDKIDESVVKKLIPDSQKIKYIELKRYPFTCQLSLYLEAKKLRRILKQLDKYDLIARGPFASWISKKAVTENCESLTLQSRAIATEEFEYVKKQTKDKSKRLLITIKKLLCHQIEKSSYQPHKKIKTQTEVVSSALKKYLMSNYNIQEKNIYVAKNDIPNKIEKSLIPKLRKNIRNKLNIPEKDTVYCYNGSCKPWQYPEKTISFFARKFKKNRNSKLLILTQDANKFEKIIKQHNLPEKSYIIKSIPHRMIYNYLAGCDFGLMFREKSIVNWTSRPTKLLEYQAVGITIIHNNTIALLSKFNSYEESHESTEIAK